jgi:hypothetical protein
MVEDEVPRYAEFSEEQLKEPKNSAQAPLSLPGREVKVVGARAVLK